jgi:hypothetical protein
MASQAHFHLNWAKERIDEMDAVLASLGERVSQLGARSRKVATGFRTRSSSNNRIERDNYSKVSDPALKIQIGQPVPVQQHDLALGLAEKVEDAHAVKV